MPVSILMPALSPTMEEGTLAKWLVKEGDTVNAGDVIAEIETDKATMEVEAVEEGTLGKILIDAGTEGVAVNTPIAVLLEEGEDKNALEGFEPGGGPTDAKKTENAADGGKAPPSSQPSPPEGEKESGCDAQTKDPLPLGGRGQGEGGRAPGKDDKDTGGRVFASPLARRLAEKHGIELDALKGSGPRGRVIKADIEQALEKGVPSKPARADAKAAPVPDGDGPLAAYGIPASRYELIKADNITRIAARRLTDSFRDIPHFPLTVDCQIDALLTFRKRANDKAPEGVKISVNDILIKAAAVALKRVPEANASWVGDGRIARHKHADVSVAVAIEGGLITPIVKDADKKGLAEISTEMKDLATRAREKKLRPEEFQGGTFSLSNLGMFGVKSFASILNPPQGMILSVGAGELRPVVRDGALDKATVMTVTLTCDHRVVDGATGARWLAAFKGFVEDPITLLI